MAISICLGIGFGGLVGLLTGLSTSPVAGTVLGIISTIIVMLVGRPGKELSVILGRAVRITTESDADQEAESDRNRGLLMVFFAFSALACLLLGIYWRTHDYWAPSPSSRIQRYVDAGYSKQEAKIAVMHRYEGILPTGWKGTNRKSYDPTSLFNADAGDVNLDDLNPQTHDFDSILLLWEAAGKPFSQFADFVKQISFSPQDKKKLLVEFWKYIKGQKQ